MRKLLIGAVVLALVGLAGCATTGGRQPYTPTSGESYQRSLEDVRVASGKVEGIKRKQREADLRKDLAKTRQELEAARAEIDELTEALRRAEEELRSAEERKAAEERTVVNKPTPSAGDGVVHTGPRGGKYTISPSGKKVYKRR